MVVLFAVIVRWSPGPGVDYTAERCTDSSAKESRQQDFSRKSKTRCKNTNGAQGWWWSVSRRAWRAQKMEEEIMHRDLS